MATSRKLKRLSDAYRFDGFRPCEALHGVFGDRMARVVTLIRRSKKRPAKDVVDVARSTTEECVVFEICRTAMHEFTWSSKFVGSAVDGAVRHAPGRRRSPFTVPSHYIKGQKYVLLSHRENLSMEGRNSLKTLLAANRRLNIAYLLKESFWQLWDYEREGWARRFFENVTTVIASSSPPGVARELSRLRRPRPPSQSEGGCLNESR